MDKESTKAVFKSILLQRYGTVKDVADGTVYLFSDTGNYIAGEVLVIDGASWRSPIALGGLKYPSFLLNDSFTPTSGNKAKL
jgi:peroxisomal 2,4-dienoyl-CoA reductase